MKPLRLAYPFPLWTIVLFVLLYVLFEPLVLEMLLALSVVSDRHDLLGTPQQQLRAEFERLVRDYRDIYIDGCGAQFALLGFAAFFYGAARALYFHPLFNVKYRQALALLPWKSGTPLPNGPLRPAPHDLFVFALMCLLAARAGNPSVAAVAAALVGAYAILVGIAGIVTGAHFSGWTTLVSLVPFLVAVDLSIWFAPFLVFALIVADRAVWHSMRLFPWSNLGIWERSANVYDESQLIRKLGWPLVHLRPSAEAELSAFDKYAILAIATLLQGLAVFGTSDPEAFLFFTVFWAIGFMFFLVDCLWYYRSPISLLGRVRTGHLFILDYDSVLLAPIASAIAVWAANVLPYAIEGLFGLIFASACFTFAVYILLFPVPSRKRWKSIARYRLLRPTFLEQDVQRV